MPASKTSRDRPSSRRRRRVFRCLASVLAILPFFFAEMALRWFDPAERPTQEAVTRDPLVDLHQLKPLFVPSADNLRWEIPPQRYNFFQPASFSRDKPSDTFRIFVVGGSTVQGRPFATETAFSSFLRIQLQQARRRGRIEVVNCGGVSYASYRVAAIVDEVIEHDPDLLVVYSGHNEFLEDRTYAGWRSVPRPLATLLAVGSRLRLVQALAEAVAPLPERTVMDSEVATRLDRIDGLAAFHRDEAWRRGVHNHFATALQRIVDRCKTAAVPLMLCVPASDIVATPPFKFAIDPSLSADEKQKVASRWRQVTDKTVDGASQRLAACRSILAADPAHAGAAYIVGREAWQQGALEEANHWLTVARDADVCPLRATSTIVQSVRQIADENWVPLLDVPALLDRRSGPEANPGEDGIPDPNWFADHVHPSVAGHQRIAEAMFDLIVSDRSLRGRDDDWLLTDAAPALAVRRQAIDDYLATLDESYFQRGKQRLEGLRAWAAGRAGTPIDASTP